MAGNEIGTDAAGTILRFPTAPASRSTPTLPRATQSAAPSSGDSNVISGNTTLRDLHRYRGVSGTVIAGNNIGTDISGALPLCQTRRRSEDRQRRPTGTTIGGIVFCSGDFPWERDLREPRRAKASTFNGVGTTGTIIAGNQVGTDLNRRKRSAPKRGRRVCRLHLGPDNTIGGTPTGRRQRDLGEDRGDGIKIVI